MAKAFELNTMNCERLMARTAGIESMAKMTSVASTSTSTTSIGVASRLPASFHVKCGPWKSAVIGTYLRINRSTGFFSGMDLALVVARHSNRGDDQEGAEDEDQPVEPFQQRHAREDEDGAEHEGPEDPPEQHPVLVRLGHGEVAEDDRPHEHVVNGQTLFDHVARVVLRGRIPAELQPHQQAEGQTDGNPEDR